ncbi:hypothetical protein JZ751_021530, partial [Albula glossodonta]
MIGGGRRREEACHSCSGLGRGESQVISATLTVTLEVEKRVGQRAKERGREKEAEREREWGEMTDSGIPFPGCEFTLTPSGSLDTHLHTVCLSESVTRRSFGNIVTFKVTSEEINTETLNGANSSFRYEQEAHLGLAVLGSPRLGLGSGNGLGAHVKESDFRQARGWVWLVMERDHSGSGVPRDHSAFFKTVPTRTPACTPGRKAGGMLECSAPGPPPSRTPLPLSRGIPGRWECMCDGLYWSLYELVSLLGWSPVPAVLIISVSLQLAQFSRNRSPVPVRWEQEWGATVRAPAPVQVKWRVGSNITVK